MSSVRVLGLGPALRQAALKPRANALRAIVPKRGVKTQSLPPSAMTGILNAQRLKRPSSPHFTIYQPQLTWLGSIANRMTGAALSVLLYGYALAYLAAPGIFDSAHVIEFIGALPEVVKYSGKVLLAAPFALHSWFGVRHLVWDSGKFLSLKGAYQTGYAMIGATAVTTLALVLM